MSTRQGIVYVARLAGTGVFDPNGDRLGRVRDVVVVSAYGEPGRVVRPRVIGFVIEVTRHRSAFLPITRVTRIAPGQVVTTGLMNVRRFQQRHGESRIIGELLDRKVTLKDAAARAGTAPRTGIVFDIGIEETRLHDWEVARVATQVGSHGFRRRADTRTVDWDEVEGLGLAEPNQGATNLLAALSTMKPADFAEAFSDLPPKRRQELAAVLDDERLADVFEELDASLQLELVEQLGPERAADVLEAMGPDDAADLLADLPVDKAEKLLSTMEPSEAEPVRQLLRYSDNVAGGLMTTEPVILPPDATIAEALVRLRDPDLTPALSSMAYIARSPLDPPTGRFLGVAHIQRLLREPPSDLVSSALDTDLEPLPPQASLREVTEHMATYNLVACPIVDENRRFVGAVSVDDVLDHLLGERWRRGADPTPTGPGTPDASMDPDVVRSLADSDLEAAQAVADDAAQREAAAGAASSPTSTGFIQRIRGIRGDRDG